MDESGLRNMPSANEQKLLDDSETMSKAETQLTEPILTATDPKTVSSTLSSCMQAVDAKTAGAAEVAKYLNHVGKQIQAIGCQGSDDPLMKLYKDCLEEHDGAFNVRNSPLGREWTKQMQLDPELREAYGKVRGYKAREDFRKAWTAKKHTDKKNMDIHEKSWEKVDETKGSYLNFGRLVESYGIHYDRAEAVKLATNHARKCLIMKGKWILWDDMDEITLYLKLNMGFHEKMAECWKQCEESFSKEPTCDANPKAASKAKAAQPPKRSSSGGSGGGGGGGGGSGHNKKQKKPLEVLMTEATKTKAMYSRVMSKAENLVQSIKESETWAWARSDACLGEMEQLIKSVKDQVSANENLGRMVLEDLKDLRADMGIETLEATVTSFNALQPDLDALHNKQDGLVKAHKSMHKKN